MQQKTDTRLARAKAKAPRNLAAARNRSLLRGRAACGALLRQRSQLLGDSPAFAAALQLGEIAGARLASIPDTVELCESDRALLARDHAGAEDIFKARLSRLVRQYRDGHELDPDNASTAELLAAHVARAASGAAAGGEAPG